MSNEQKSYREQKPHIEEFLLPKPNTRKKKPEKEKEERERKPPPNMTKRARRADRDIQNLLSRGDDPREAMELAEEWDIGHSGIY